MQDYSNSWKNGSVFIDQLALNKQELEGRYPEHWNAFLSFMNNLPEQYLPYRMLDIECGCGAFAALCRKHSLNVAYTGIDYSEEAIRVASKEWPYAHFMVMNYKNLTKDLTDKFDILLASSLHNVMPDGDDCMQFLLSLQPKYFIFLKILITDQLSHFRTYTAYNKITTYEFRHNRHSLLKLIDSAGYYQEIIHSSDSVLNMLLRKKSDV